MLYRIRGAVSFDRVENGAAAHYDNQSIDAEAEAGSPAEALIIAHEHLQNQGIDNVLWTDGPRYYVWASHELGQGWTEVSQNG